MTQTRSIRRKWPGRWPNWAPRSSPLPSFPCWILQTRSPLPTAFGLGFRWFGGRCGGNCRGGRQLGGLGSRRKGAGGSADTPLLVFRFVVAKSACLRFRLTAKTAPAPLLLLSNANPLRWALRWGPPSAAYIISEFGDLVFPFWDRLCCGGAQVVRWGCDTNPSLPL